jgi:hypothetical protein
LLVVDWGAVMDGYVSDLTRTFAIGEVDAEWNKIAAVGWRQPGAMPVAPVSHAPSTVRPFGDRQGSYGQYFTHRTGRDRDGER